MGTAVSVSQLEQSLYDDNDGFSLRYFRTWQSVQAGRDDGKADRVLPTEAGRRHIRNPVGEFRAWPWFCLESEVGYEMDQAHLRRKFGVARWLLDCVRPPVQFTVR